VFLVVEPRDDAIDLRDLVPHWIAGTPRGNTPRSRIFAFGKSVRISRTIAPMPSAISGPVFAPVLLVPIITITAFG
jgi:hypothetical protein